jgi:hypothetical protein
MKRLAAMLGYAVAGLTIAVAAVGPLFWLAHRLVFPHIPHTTYRLRPATVRS